MSDMGPSTDGDFIRLAVARYERPLILYVTHVLNGDGERARDVVQEAFLRLIGQEREQVGSHLAEWLYAVCRNLAIDIRRKEKRMEALSDASASAMRGGEMEPGDRAEAEDAFKQVLQNLATLPHNQQECIRLKFQHGMSYKQISDVTSLTSTNVGFLIHTGLKTLRRKMTVDVSEARHKRELNH